MRQYDSYKDSDVEWIGEIPRHWEIRRLKNVSDVKPSNIDKHIFPDEIQVRLCNYTDVYYNDIITNSTELKKGSCNPLEFEKFKLEKEDVIITKDSESPDDIGIPCLVIDDLNDVVCGYHLTLIRPVSLKGGYIFRFIQSNRTRNYFKVHSNGITRYGLGKSSIENLFIPYPPFSEQHQIVSYLDRKTAQIDALIEQTKRKIELLKEKRTALINEVVTKGLNPNVEMKDSGVEWIGEIPRHWMVSKFKYDSSTPVQYGINISGDKYVEEGIRFVRITDISESGDLNPNEGKYLIPEDVPNEFLLRKFDVLFCRSGHTVGKTYLHTSDGLFTSGGYLVRFNFRNYTESKFIFYISKTNFYWDWIKLNTVVSTIENVNGDKYQNFIYPKPPVSEQIEIISYLDEQTQLIDKTVSIEERRIELLKEYRQSLISEVVTGKRKVVNDE